MKNTYKLIAAIGITAIGLIIGKQATAQTTDSKIPFQGSLYDQGTPVNGTNEMVFSIATASWAETHSVQVVNGLYTVVLGSVTPLPANLFTGVDSQQLAITVAGTSIGSVALYAPFITNEMVRENMPDSIYATFDSAAAEHSTLDVTINGTGTGSNTAIKAVASTEGDNRGIKGYALSDISTGGHIGVFGKGEGQGKYNHGVYGLGKGNGNGDEGHDYGEGSINFGIEGRATGNAWNNTGVEGSNYGSAGKFNYGVSGVSSAGTATSENTGVRGSAFGSGINRGIYGFANGGTENWAGYFDGNTKIIGDLHVDGNILGTIAPAPGEDFHITNPSGDLRADLNYYEPNDAGSLVLYGANDSTKVILGSTGGGYGGFLGLYDSTRNIGVNLRTNNKGQGNLFTYNENHQNVGWFGGYANDGFLQLISFDDTETFSGAALIGSYADGKLPEFYVEGSVQANHGLGRLKVEENNGQEYGALELNRSNGNASFSVRMANDTNGNDPSGYTPELFMHGDNSPNIKMGGQPWENGDLGFLTVFTDKPDGGGWFYGAVTTTANNDGSTAWGHVDIFNDGVETISLSGQNGEISTLGTNMGVKHWEGNNGNQRGFLHLMGTVDGLPNNDAQRVYLEVNDDGSGSYGVLGLKNYTNDGGGNGKTTIHLNGENGDINIDGTLYQASDKRFKKNIETIENALDNTLKLRGVSYNWKDKNKSQHTQIGVIAQEVEEVYPEFVHTKEDGYKAVNYAQMTAVLIEAVKELNAKVEALEGENTELKAELSKVDLLEQKIKRFEKILTGSKEDSQSSSLTASN